jgi:hypothetical protein
METLVINGQIYLSGDVGIRGGGVMASPANRSRRRSSS